MTNREVSPARRWETFKALVSLMWAMGVIFELHKRNYLEAEIDGLRVKIRVSDRGFGQTIITPYVEVWCDGELKSKFWGIEEVPRNKKALLDKILAG
jgi:hypothetical protein